MLTLDLAIKEVLNAVWKHAAVLHTYPTEIAIEKYNIIVKLMEGEAITVDNEMAYLKEAFNIALQARITIYDALYIAQAIKRRARLLTSDDQQARAAQNLGLEIIKV